MAKKKGKKKGKSKKKLKAKKRRFIKKISKDGKISKKEGKKAAKKNISLNKIRNRRIGDYRESARNYQRGVKPSARNSSGQRRPTYEPLKIKRGALQADYRRQESNRKRRSESKRRSEPKRRSQPKPYRSSQKVREQARAEVRPEMFEPAYEQPRYDEPMVNNYEQQLADIRGDLADSLMQTDDPRNRRYVLGIRTARRKRNSQGSRGTFGRRGKRIQGLQSTSINL